MVQFIWIALDKIIATFDAVSIALFLNLLLWPFVIRLENNPVVMADRPSVNPEHIFPGENAQDLFEDFPINEARNRRPLILFTEFFWILRICEKRSQSN